MQGNTPPGSKKSGNELSNTLITDSYQTTSVRVALEDRCPRVKQQCAPDLTKQSHPLITSDPRLNMPFTSPLISLMIFKK